MLAASAKEAVAWAGPYGGVTSSRTSAAGSAGACSGARSATRSAAGVEFDSLAAIRGAHGERGVTDYVPAYGRRGAVTDDTQMTLFTTEGLIRAQVRRDTGAWHPPTDIHRAYLRWAATQSDWGPDERRKDIGWLAREEWLYSRRAPAGPA